MLFNNGIERNQNKTHYEECSSSHTSLRDGSGYQSGWTFGKVPNSRWPAPSAPQNRPYLWKWCACISYYLALIPPCIYATISIIKKSQYNFPRGQVEGHLEFFRKFIRFGSATLPMLWWWYQWCTLQIPFPMYGPMQSISCRPMCVFWSSITCGTKTIFLGNPRIACPRIVLADNFTLLIIIQQKQLSTNDLMMVGILKFGQGGLPLKTNS